MFEEFKSRTAAYHYSSPWMFPTGNPSRSGILLDDAYLGLWSIPPLVEVTEVAYTVVACTAYVPGMEAIQVVNPTDGCTVFVPGEVAKEVVT